VRVVVAGGAGFVGSHLCDALLARGDEVVAVDDLSTGSTANLAAAREHRGFELVERDVTVSADVEGQVDAVCNLASPASPPRYLSMPLETLRVGADGTRNLLELAGRHDARLVHASTSEVYGDPKEHPQREGYWGNVNPIGPRSVYDEAKRYAEALVMAHNRTLGTHVGIARIFNTYGPRLDPRDGRVVSTFIVQALRGEPLTVHGDGTQTRSLCYVDDLVDGADEPRQPRRAHHARPRAPRDRRHRVVVARRLRRSARGRPGAAVPRDLARHRDARMVADGRDR